jgi:hypothetical protein
MKARTPKLNLEPLAIESVNIQQFILNDCATYAEAAQFFGVDTSTVGRWMMGVKKPHPACYTAVAAYKKLQEVAA